MKRTTTVCFVFCLAAFIVTAPASAQMGFSMGIKIGQNRSHFASDDFDNRNLQTVCGGLAVQFSLMGLFSIEADALYSTKGCVVIQGTVNEEIRLHYLSIPFVLKKNSSPSDFIPSFWEEWNIQPCFPRPSKGMTSRIHWLPARLRP